ncbi:hypothetical protein ACD077_001623 [Escherichia coli]|nr:hypothetical protein [Escherichia coli]HAW2189026.1 hypothetical protein [Escherichia coli]
MSASSLPLPQGKSVSLKQFVSRHINEIGLLVVIAILYLVFSLNAPGFISLNNQMNVLRDAATIGIAAWAMTLIIISGEIDVSVGPMVAFVSVCLAFLLQFEVPLAVACLLVLLLGALMGTLVVVGGTALSGGRGSLFGTLLGVLVITLIGNGLVLLGINSFFQQVVRGVIIVVAVLANILLTQRSSKAKR